MWLTPHCIVCEWFGAFWLNLSWFLKYASHALGSRWFGKQLLLQMPCEHPFVTPESQDSGSHLECFTVRDGHLVTGYWYGLIFDSVGLYAYIYIYLYTQYTSPFKFVYLSMQWLNHATFDWHTCNSILLHTGVVSKELADTQNLEVKATWVNALINGTTMGPDFV